MTWQTISSASAARISTGAARHRGRLRSGRVQSRHDGRGGRRRRRSTRCAARCSAASTAWLMSVRGGDAAGDDGGARRSPRPGIAISPSRFLDRAHAELHGHPRPRRRRDRGARRHGALRARFPQADAAVDAARRGRRRRCVLCDANLPAAALARWPALAAGKPLFAIAISPAKAVRLAPDACRARLPVHEQAEAAALTGSATRRQPRTGRGAARPRPCARGVVTRRGAPVVAFDAEARVLARAARSRATSPTSPAPAMRWPARRSRR